MNFKKMYPIAAILFVLLIGGCKKEQINSIQDPLSDNSRALKRGNAQDQAKRVKLGDAGHFAILAEAGINNVGPSAVDGDVGASPVSGSAIQLTCPEVSGKILSVDAAGPLPCRKTDPRKLSKAVQDMHDAYNDAAARTNPDFVNLGAGNIGGLTLAPGLYKWDGSVTIPSDITLSGKGGDVWIFQINGALTVSSAVKINAGSHAKDKNIFWQVAGVVTLGTYSQFEGIVLGLTDINLQTGASIHGDLLSQNMVSLSMNAITKKADPDDHHNNGASAGIDLGVANNFAILSQSGITDVSPSAITGNIGSSPITGAAILVPCTEVTGNIYSVDAAGPFPCVLTDATLLSAAVGDMQLAYDDAAGRSNPDFLNLGAGNIGGLTLRHGLYKFTSAVTIPTNITISGNANDVWIFQVAGTLDMSTAVNITLSGGAQAKNIIWQVSGAVTLGTNSHFEGVILGQTNIAVQTGASVNGMLFAQTAVTLQMNTITKPN